jgi:precorrin-6x reductase
MSQIVVFGGTVEGRELAVWLHDRNETVTVSVTSEYARMLLPENMNCHVGVLDREQMICFLKETQANKVIDCTHPYAVRATENIRACCAQLNIPYERVSRPPSEGEWMHYVEHVEDSQKAAEALMRTEGNILLTTGSHTLDIYTNRADPARIWARVLPNMEALKLCAEANIPPSHIIAMQGPFSAAFNAALYDQLDIRVMVSKDSGAQGGVAEKVIPALERDIHVILIDRPKE